MSIFFYIFVDETENLLVMKKFFVGLMLLCGAVALHADDVIYYFHQKDLSGSGSGGWWRSDNCQPAIYATSADGQTQNAPWPGVEMSRQERNDGNDLWHLSIDTTIYKKITFVRVYYSAGICTDQNSKTQEFTVSNLNGRNFFSLTSETQMEIVEGEWFYYGNAYSLPGQPMYYLLGDAAALGAWSTESALPMEGDSIVLNLDPGTYNFKVLTGQSWDTPSYGYSAVNSNCTDVAVQEGSDGNIQITLGSGSEIVVKNVGAGTSSGVICITGNQGTPDGGNLGATTVYCYVTQEWWTDQGATVGMYAYDDSDNFNAAFPGVRMTQSDQVPGLWSASIDPSMYNHIIFTRMAPEDGETLDWGAKTGDLSVPTSATPVFVITSETAQWSSNSQTVTGYWTAYNEEGNYNTQGGATSTYYLTGSFNEWSLGEALVMDGDSIRITLQAGTYSFKVLTSNVSWDGAMGYSYLNPSCSTDGPITTDGQDDNIIVTLTDAGILTFRVEQVSVCVRLYELDVISDPIDATIDGIRYTLSGSAPWTAEVAQQQTDAFDLQIVNIPSTVTYNEQTYTVTGIAENAFYNANTVTDVTLPNTVTYIGTMAFNGCNNLTSVNLPTGMLEIGEAVFDETGLTDPLFNDVVFVFMPREYEGEFTIPTGIQVIANSAFYGCSSMTAVTIPSSVTTIGMSAFANCSSLTRVVLPSNVTVIGEAAFDGCSQLEEVNIPDGVAKIANYTFRDCQALSSITIPSSVDSIGDEAFGSCIELHTVICMPTTPPYLHEYAFIGIQALNELHIYVPASALSAYLADAAWQFPTPVQALCPYSGECGANGDNLTWTLSCDSVLTISGSGAMANYNGSSSVPWHNYQARIRHAVIYEGVTSLSNYSTFEECTALESVIIPEGITSLGDYTFNNCTSLKGIDLPSTITSLGSYCFSGCSGMDSIVSRAITPPTANGSTFGIGDDAIRVYVPVSAIAAYQSADGWSSFTNFMALPEGCIIASGTCGADGYNIVWVLDCDSVMTISGTGEMASYTTNSNGQAPWASYGSQIRDIVIEEGITKASPYGFYNAGSYTNGAYNNVRSVTIPSTMNTLVNNNFYQCPIETVTINSDSIVGRTTYSSSSNLQNIFGAQVRQYIIGSSVHSIAASAFYNQSADSVRSIILPEGLTSIGDWGFGYLENMDSITLPSTLQSIGADAFYGSGLKAITIPAGVTTMGGQAFQNCDKLTSLTLEEGLTSIGTSAFANCTALPEVTIPESMQTISSGAFTGCTNLTKVTVLSSTWVGETKSSSSITKQAIGGYVRELILGDQITTLGKYAFSGLDSLRSVTLPANLEIIGNEAFSACKKLQSITLPSTVTTLGNYAFNGCTALDSIRLNEGLLRIGAQVFYQCTSLQRVTLPASLIGINGTSFYGCTGLTEMTLPDGALHPDSLGNNIFGGCTNLTKLTINSRTLCEGTYTTSQNLKTNFGQDALRTLIIGEGVTSIGNYAFYNASISTLVLPSTLTSVGNGSFGSCSSLTNVTSNALTPPTIQSGSFSKQDTLNVLCAAKEAYQDADYWKNFTTILADCAGGYCGGENNEENVIWSLSGEGVLTITGTGKMASYQSDTIVPWYGHRAEILSVIIGEGVESITPYAFLQCWNLASVTIPSTVNSIGGLAFGHCSSLESVTIPKGITYIEGYTFTGCTSLSSIEIPASVTQIANEAFSGCTSLGNIYCRGAYPPVDDLQNAFKNIDTSIVTVFVPSRSINLYKAAEGWKKFSNIRGQDDPNRFTIPISTEWQFIMLPGVTGDQWCGLPMDSILSDSTLVWARYVGNYRAEGRSGWQLFDPAANEARFLCTDAYIVRANGAGATLTMKVPVDAANMTSVTYTYEKHTARHAENANWNFVGNPFPYYYNILAQLDALGITTPITIWNGTGYELFTPGIDTERMLAPFEAFFIQVPEDVESVVITFSGEYIIM